MRIRLGKRWFAWIYGFVDRRQRPHTAAIRDELLADLEGDVLDVGVGPGTNFPHYPPGARVTAVDYSAQMLERARDALPLARAPIELREADATALPFPDASFDAYVSTLTLCSVADLDHAIDEAWRVLRPGGALRIFEHVRSPTPWKARVQTAVSPLWSVVWDGCHFDRDPAAAIRARGFEVIDEQHPHVRGEPVTLLALRAVKPR